MILTETHVGWAGIVGVQFHHEVNKIQFSVIGIVLLTLDIVLMQLYRSSGADQQNRTYNHYMIHGFKLIHSKSILLYTFRNTKINNTVYQQLTSLSPGGPFLSF